MNNYNCEYLKEASDIYHNYGTIIISNDLINPDIICAEYFIDIGEINCKVADNLDLNGKKKLFNDFVSNIEKNIDSKLEFYNNSYIISEEDIICFGTFNSKLYLYINKNLINMMKTIC